MNGRSWSRRLAVVDLFCGMGGFSCGARQAGADVVLAIDSWPEALATHKHNHPSCKHAQIELGGDLPTAARFIISHVPKGQPWHLHASPPCQLLSSANRMNYNPAAGMRLVNWSLALIGLCRPTSWSLEQVPAAANLLRQQRIPCAVVDASWYGVPQTRRRCYAGQGWTLPPVVGGGANTTTSMAAALPHVSKKATHVRGNSNSRAVYRNGRHVRNEPLSGWQGFRSIHEPSFTLLGHGRRLQLYTSSGRLAGRSKRGGQSRAQQPVFLRDLMPDEYLVLQGFPREYSFPETVTKRNRYKLIGNSLVPRIAFLIVTSAQKTCNKTRV